MPGWVSPWELLILLAFVLLLFGPKRLPEMGRSLGKGMREFKDSITGNSKDDEEEERKPEELPPASTASPAEDEHPVGAAQSRADERDSTS
ncbi:MAG: twin-arginine translocase TatA/TatE family subunit [Actinomycetota bacterium]|nr:twin-arginine translocase TatA/TatE family subunit [Actinomycetota bacterium]